MGLSDYESQEMGIQIRYYQDADFPQYEQLLKDIGIYDEILDKREIIQKKIQYDPESILVAEARGRLIGTVYILYDPWRSLIYHLGVHPDYRRKGLGNKLMDEAEGKLKARGINRAILFVVEDNEQVVEFYQKRGWFILGQPFYMEKEL
jgi:ribosomal protein S18 acetylase RimI-like enzyme